MQALAFVAALSYVAFGVLGWSAKMSLVDPLWPWIVIPMVLFGLWGGALTRRVDKRRLPVFLLAVSFVITVHVYVGLVLHDLDHPFIVADFLIMGGFVATASFTAPHKRLLVAYLGTVIVFSVGAVLLIQKPATNPYHFLLAILTFVVLAYISVSSQSRNFRRLSDSREALRLDIEERRRTERALRESESRSTALLDAVPDIMIGLGQGGIVESVRNHHRSALGASLLKLIGRPIQSLASDDKGEHFAAAVTHTLATGETSIVACELHEPQATSVEVRILKVGASEALALVRDVTQEKTMEARLRQTERLVSLGTLVGGVAHEINNPLSYLLNNIDFLERHLGSGRPDPDLSTALHEARDGARRIQDIVGTLNEHARPSLGDSQPVDLNAVVRSALRILDNRIRHRASVETELGQIPHVKAHPRLVQVAVNLICNGIDAMPDRPTAENRIVVRTFSRADNEVVLVVSDNGEGMLPNILGSIFDPFFTTKGPGGGTGLGLYLCHRLVTSFGGTIAVESTPGSGSRFTVVLHTAGAKDAPRVAAEPEPPPLQGVLIVDDEPLVARSLTRVMNGSEVSVVSSAAAALEACRTRDFDLIVCDVMMPEMDGIAFYEALAERRPHLRHRVVFMTGGAFSERARRFLATVSNATLSKPFTYRQLYEAAMDIAARSSVDDLVTAPIRGSSRPARSDTGHSPPQV
jgi:two-component system cell cycle sensor histidine kinase/response regulator CckA